MIRTGSLNHPRKSDHKNEQFPFARQWSFRQTVTNSNAEILNVFPLGMLDVLGESLQRASGHVMLDKQSVNVFPERPHHQAHHHALQNRVQVQKFIWLQLYPFFLHFLLELPLAVLHQIVFHPGHELSYVPHNHVRAGFFPFLRTLNEVVDILREGGGFVGSQLKGVRPYGGACARVIAVLEGLQPWRSYGAKKNSIRTIWGSTARDRAIGIRYRSVLEWKIDFWGSIVGYEWWWPVNKLNVGIQESIERFI